MAVAASTAPATRKHLSRKKWTEWLAGYTLIGPYLFTFVLFGLIALVSAIYFSFTSYDILSPPEWVGLRNYERILCIGGTRCDEVFTRYALPNTFLYVICVVPVQTFIALVLAFAVDQVGRGKALFRTVFYIPSVTSSVVISLIFLWLFSPLGLINRLLGTQINWLFNTTTALPTIMIVNIWATSATLMLIFIAALQNIPTAMYEAAAMDGASKMRIFFSITIPSLLPVIFFVVATGVIGCFQVFDQIYVMTNGGPQNATTTMAYLTYFNAFRDVTPRMGYASAMAIVMTVIILVCTIFTRKLLDRDVTK